MTATVFVLNGPNLNLLGVREPEVYGADTLADIEERLAARGKELGIAIDFRQTNAEGQLIDWFQEARTNAQGIIVNPGAYTHTSIALLDSVKVAGVPTIEVHLSNIHAREDFRHRSYVSPAARGVIVGFGAYGYELALDGLSRIIAKT